jgi:hypothetical protein
MGVAAIRFPEDLGPPAASPEKGKRSGFFILNPKPTALKRIGKK